jgi:hypothetical protein
LRQSISVLSPRFTLCRVEPSAGVVPSDRDISLGRSAAIGVGSRSMALSAGAGSWGSEASVMPAASIVSAASRISNVASRRSSDRRPISWRLSPVIAGSA